VAPVGAVAGVQATILPAKAPNGGVLGAVAQVGGGQLPFTGFSVWIAVLIGIVLVVVGLALVRRGRTTL
jgi:hypothetical protein